MNCPRCGQALTPYASFCNRCGQQFAISQPQVAVQQGFTSVPSQQAAPVSDAWRMLDILVGLIGIGAGLYFLLAIGRSWPVINQGLPIAKTYGIGIALDAIAAIVLGVGFVTRNKNAYVGAIGVCFVAVMLRLSASWAGGSPTGFWWELLPGLYALLRYVDPPLGSTATVPRTPISRPMLPPAIAQLGRSPKAMVLIGGAALVLVVALFLSHGHHYSSPADYFSSRRVELGASGYATGGNAIVGERQAEWIVWTLADGTRQQDLVAADRDGGVTILGGNVVPAGQAPASRMPGGYEVPVAGD